MGCKKSTEVGFKIQATCIKHDYWMVENAIRLGTDGKLCAEIQGSSSVKLTDAEWDSGFMRGFVLEDSQPVSDTRTPPCSPFNSSLVAWSTLYLVFEGGIIFLLLLHIKRCNVVEP